MAGGKVVGILFIPFDLGGTSCKEKQRGGKWLPALNASEAEGHVQGSWIPSPAPVSPSSFYDGTGSAGTHEKKLQTSELTHRSKITVPSGGNNLQGKIHR